MIFAFPFILLAIGAAFWAVQARLRRDRSQYIDIGWAFFAIVLVYGIVPGVGFALAELGIGELIDSRMSGGFDTDVVEGVQLTFIAFVLGFATFYSRFRRFSRVRHDHRREARPKVGMLITLTFVLAAGQPAIKWWLGVQGGSEYIDSYTELRSLPLIYQQLLGVMFQVSFASILAAVVFAVASRPEAHVRVALVLGVFVVYASLGGGMRMVAFLSFFAYLVAASIYVRGFSTAKVVALALPALLLFMLAGVLRENNPDSNFLGIFQSGEFTSLFINAIDIKQRLDDGAGAEVRFAIYLVDVLRLIPAQVFGGEKLDPATWYVQSFYPDYHDAGGGLAFGLMAESVAGFGAPEAFLRGALLALLFAWVGNRLADRAASPAAVFAYVWFVVMSYQSFRDTTLTIMTRGLYQLLPILLLLMLTSRRPRRTRATAPTLQHH